MICPKCKEEMDYEDGTHRWNEREYYCTECDIVRVEDITGDLIDQAKDNYEMQTQNSQRHL